MFAGLFRFMPARAGALRRVSADHGAGMGPIRLSDAQLDAIMRACQPLRPDVRSAFVEAVVSALKDREIGDGAVYLAIARAQRQFFDAPLSTDERTQPHRRAAPAR